MKNFPIKYFAIFLLAWIAAAIIMYLLNSTQ